MKTLTAEDEASLDRILKRCSAATREAAREFRRTDDPRQVPAIVDGIVEQYVERDLREWLRHRGDGLLLRDHLRLDSLAIMEMMVVLEDVLRIPVHSEDLRDLRTVADLKEFILGRLRSGPEPSPVKDGNGEIDAPLPNERH
jgi:3-hydroxyacyl-[acyl-carrier-protein] dehydratase